MNRQIKIRLVTALACCWLSLEAHTSEPPALQNNPFARPPSERIAAQSPAGIGGNDPDQPLDLRATMVGSRDRLANVGGRILRPGDEVRGFVLLQVFEDHAIFTRNGNRQTIYVKPDLLENDE